MQNSKPRFIVIALSVIAMVGVVYLVNRIHNQPSDGYLRFLAEQAAELNRVDLRICESTGVMYGTPSDQNGNYIGNIPPSHSAQSRPAGSQVCLELNRSGTGEMFSKLERIVKEHKNVSFTVMDGYYYLYAAR